MASKDNDIIYISPKEFEPEKNLDNSNNKNTNNKFAIEIPNEEVKDDKINPFEVVETKGIDELEYKPSDTNYDNDTKKYSKSDSTIDIPSPSRPERRIKYLKSKEKGNVSFIKQLLLPRVYVTAILSAMTILLATVINGFILSKYEEPTNEEGIQSWKEKYKVFSYFYIILLCPVAEEIIFRKVLYGFFKRFSKLVGYLISCFVYAMAHFSFNFSELFSELRYFPIYFIIGVILTYTYDYDGYLAASILANILYSSIILIFEALK